MSHTLCMMGYRCRIEPVWSSSRFPHWLLVSSTVANQLLILLPTGRARSPLRLPKHGDPISLRVHALPHPPVRYRSALSKVSWFLIGLPHMCPRTYLFNQTDFSKVRRHALPFHSQTCKILKDIFRILMIRLIYPSRFGSLHLFWRSENARELLANCFVPLNGHYLAPIGVESWNWYG